MKKSILTAVLLAISTFMFALPAGRWWVPECNSSDHDHEYEEYNGFELCYEEQFEQPMFVSYQLTKEQVNTDRKRVNSFREDTNISTGSATLADYKGSGYSRGHLAPNSDMNYSEVTQRECFLLSNMSPQEQNYFNGGIWNKVEIAVRDIGKDYDYTYVVTGPILDKKNFKTIGTNKVAVPDEYYKIAVFVKDEKIVNSFAVIMSQTNKLASTAKNLNWNDPRFITTIDEIEKRTGIDFFKSLDDYTENYLESYKYGNTFDPQFVVLDNSKVVKNTTYKKAGTVNTTIEETTNTTTKDTTTTNKEETNITKNLVDKDYLSQKLNTKMYIVNIAKNSKTTKEIVLYSIGYYRLENKINKYTLERGIKITYEDKTNPKTLAEAIKEGNVTLSDKDVDTNISVDDYAIIKAYENKEATVEELAEIYGMTIENLWIKLGILKVKI